ncbi:MAG TPA: hypothetical protein VF447_07635 [Terriglobales bacterium]
MLKGPMSDLRPSSDGQFVISYERLRNGPYFADFRRDKRLYPEVYHCIIQREGSTEVLNWSQHRSLEAAMETAERELKRLILDGKAVQQG